MTEGGAGGGWLVVLTCRDPCSVVGQGLRRWKGCRPTGRAAMRCVGQRPELDWCRTGTSATRLRSLDPRPDETSVPRLRAARAGAGSLSRVLCALPPVIHHYRHVILVAPSPGIPPSSPSVSAISCFATDYLLMPQPSCTTHEHHCIFQATVPFAGTRRANSLAHGLQHSADDSGAHQRRHEVKIPVTLAVTNIRRNSRAISGRVEVLGDQALRRVGTF